MGLVHQLLPEYQSNRLHQSYLVGLVYQLLLYLMNFRLFLAHLADLADLVDLVDLVLLALLVLLEDLEDLLPYWVSRLDQ